MLHLAATALPPLLFAALYSKAMAGQYLLGQKVVWGPMALVGQAYAQVFVAQASKALHDEPSAIPEKIDQLTRRLLTLATLPMLPLVFAGGPIFAWAFGPQWAEAGYFMQILALTQLAQFVVGPIFPVLNLIGKQDALLKCDIFGFVTIVGGIVLCHALGGSPRQAIATYAVGTAAMYGALYFVSVRCARGLA